MKLQLTLLGLVFGSLVSFAQDSGLETLTVPEDTKISSPKRAGTTTELSLPESTTSATVMKSNASDPKKAAPKDNVGAILDFEGEVIEGERRRPDLFLQISIDNIKFDSLIYNRDDFNDYLEVDRKSRTRFLKMK